VKVVKHAKYEMYFAIYPDGALTADFYGLARAKNHTVVLAETVGRNDRRQRSAIPSPARYSSSTVASSL
jgi:hypothetical protein